MAPGGADASPPHTTVPVVCAVIERGPLFLAARRAPGQSNANLWEFPGGKVHGGETAEAALARELQEELSLKVEITARLTPQAFSYPWISIELIPFVCTLAKGEPFPHEHAEIRWLSADDAPALSWTQADVPILREYLEFRRRRCA